MLTGHNKCFDVDGLPCRQGNRLNLTFCGLARDTLLSIQDTEKLNFDTNYITIHYVYSTQLVTLKVVVAMVTEVYIKHSKKGKFSDNKNVTQMHQMTRLPIGQGFITGRIYNQRKNSDTI